MKFSNSMSKLRVGAGMAAGQVGGTSVFICDVASNCGVHQGTRKAKTAFSVQELKCGNHCMAIVMRCALGTQLKSVYGKSMLAYDVGILNRLGDQRSNWGRSGFRIRKSSETAQHTHAFDRAIKSGPQHPIIY